MNKILVLGGDGMLGHKVFQRLRADFSGTLCTMRESPSIPPLDRVRVLEGPDVVSGIDAMKCDSLVTLLRSVKPEFTVNCIGIVKQRQEAQDSITSITINSLLPHRLAAIAAEWGGRVIHFSTDCVFDG
jgi:dTDP-4-dehydrorhamnose reductase